MCSSVGKCICRKIQHAPERMTAGGFGGGGAYMLTCQTWHRRSDHLTARTAGGRSSFARWLLASRTPALMRSGGGRFTCDPVDTGRHFVVVPFGPYAKFGSCVFVDDDDDVDEGRGSAGRPEKKTHVKKESHRSAGWETDTMGDAGGGQQIRGVSERVRTYNKTVRECTHKI